MPYTILRFKKDKGGAIAGCERHNERKKEAYKSNPDIDITRTKYNYHIIQAGVRIDIWTHFMRGCIIDYVH